ncbi:MAG: hypothetical protein RL722_1481 [Pseudomonadota bacterium]|jgi:hypothetical protein
MVLIPARLARTGRPLSRNFMRPVLAFATLALLAACSPALDWRDARLGGTVEALLPCKPDRLERQLPLAGGTAQALMLVCEAQGATWSVARYELGAPDRVGAALAELREHLATNLGGQEKRAAMPGLPTGFAPVSEAGRSHVSGHRPGGQAVEVEALALGEASRAYQFVVILPGVASASLQAGVSQFFEGVRLSR